MRVLSILLSLMLVAMPCFGGIDLNGDADYINIDTIINDIDLTNDWTVCAWVEDSSTVASDAFFSFADTGTVEDVSLGTISTTNDLKIFSNGKTAGDGSTISTGEIIFVCLQYDLSETNFMAYLNGSLDYTVSDGGITLSSLDNARIGGRETTGNALILNGSVYHYGAWDILLTGDEINNMYKSRMRRIELQTQASNIVCSLPLDDYADGTALNTDADGYKDLSGNENHGQGVDANANSTNVAETVLSYPPN